MHTLVTEAAAGRLPDWSVAGPERRAHVERVSALLAEWAEGLGLEPLDAARWRAAGLLHDCLRDEREDVLRPRVPPALAAWPGPLLHGPAAAERLRVEGVDDGELLLAVGYHTVGDPRFGALGRALFAADFLEPGRTFAQEWRAELRARAPEALDDVVLEVARARLRHRLERGAPILERSLAFWNALTGEAA